MAQSDEFLPDYGMFPGGEFVALVEDWARPEVGERVIMTLDSPGAFFSARFCECGVYLSGSLHTEKSWDLLQDFEGFGGMEGGGGCECGIHFGWGGFGWSFIMIGS